MAFLCFKCGTAVTLPASGRPGRGDSCDSCRTDLRVCRNCKHYDPAAYNQCREPSAERVVEKERANFCDYFSFTTGGNQVGGAGTQKKDYLKSLEDIFKK